MSLKDYYRTSFQLMQHHQYNLSDIENILPWERDIYLSQLIEYIESENEKIQLEQMEAQAKNRPRIGPF
tara:strand:- start:299 stop:505 length:207 start_codon:yes stop_codon:yes gene_type:complete